MTADTPSRELLALAKRIDTARNCDCMEEPFIPEMTLAERDTIIDVLRLAAKPADDDVREALEQALALKITDSNGREVAEDSLHELRKAVRAALTTKAKP